MTIGSIAALEAILIMTRFVDEEGDFIKCVDIRRVPRRIVSIVLHQAETLTSTSGV